MNLINFFSDYAESIKIGAGSYIFQENHHDLNIYYIQSGKIFLKQGNRNIMIVEEGQILGEKSFFSDIPKSLDALVLEDSNLRKLTRNKFTSLPEALKIEFFQNLIVDISNRVDLLNLILNYVKNISEKIYEYQQGLEVNKIEFVFEEIFIFKHLMIFKYEYGCLSKIVGDMILDENLENIIIKNKENNIEFFTNQDLIIITTKDYIIYFAGIKKISEYVVNNIFLYLRPLLHMFVQKLENIKNDSIINRNIEY